MNDQQVIEQAYAGQLQNLFNAFVSGAMASGDMPAAEAHFTSEVAFLRKVRDRAIASL